jgi:hypothetical protein
MEPGPGLLDAAPAFGVEPANRDTLKHNRVERDSGIAANPAAVQALRTGDDGSARVPRAELICQTDAERAASSSGRAPDF